MNWSSLPEIILGITQYLRFFALLGLRPSALGGVQRRHCRSRMLICRYRLLPPVRANGYVRGTLQPFLHLTGNLFLCGGFFGE
jgi:hypothetical protein